MRKILKILNPFIFILNVLNYFGHLEEQRFNEKYEPYDFDRDISYF